MIGEFLDHGDSVEQDSPRGQPLWEEYVATTEGKRRIVKPGDRLDIPGVELVIVAAHRRVRHRRGGIAAFSKSLYRAAGPTNFARASRSTLKTPERTARAQDICSR